MITPNGRRMPNRSAALHGCGAPGTRAMSPDAGAAPERGSRIWVEGSRGGPRIGRVIGRREDDWLLEIAAGPGGLQVGDRLELGYSVRELPCAMAVEVIGIDGEAAIARAVDGPHRVQRRGALRVPLRLRVAARPGGGGDDDGPLTALTENLSLGGALMRTDRGLAAHSELTVALDADDPELAALPARVVRCDFEDADPERPWRVALAFRDLSIDQEDALSRVVLMARHGSTAA